MRPSKIFGWVALGLTGFAVFVGLIGVVVGFILLLLEVAILVG